MPGDQRFPNEKIPDAAVQEVVEIRAADPTRAQFQEDLARPGFRLGDAFHSEILRSVDLADSHGTLHDRVPSEREARPLAAPSPAAGITAG